MTVFASLAALSMLAVSAPAEAAQAARPVAVAQGTVAFGLAFETDRGVEHVRFTFAPMAETLEILPARRVRLDANADVPARIEGAFGDRLVELHFDAVEGVADVAGRVFLDRAVTVRGAATGRLTMALELDLLGLGDETPRVSVRSAKVVGVQGLGGARLVSSPMVAAPAAPIPWSTATVLTFERSQGILRGRVSLPYNPMALALDGKVAVALVLYDRDGPRVRRTVARADVERFVADGLLVEWSQQGRRWVGEVRAKLDSAQTLERASVRFGNIDSAMSIQVVGLATVADGAVGTTAHLAP